MNIYVQRMEYNTAYDFLKSEILKGRLRQGWGVEGADLHGGPEKFIETWRTAGAKESDEWLRRKYNNLRAMLDIEPGDIIIVPKLDMSTPPGDWEAWDKTFTVFVATEGYRFEPVPVPEWDGWKEFGHITGVKILGSYSYHQNDITRTISKKFQSYRSPENRVKNEVMMGAVQKLVAHRDRV